MTNFNDFLNEQMKDPEFKAEWDALDPEFSVIEAMLKARQPFLCQQCHADASHPGNVPAIRGNMPNAVSSNIGPGYAQARGCSNCHTNIHGSNSPSNATSSGPFRFFR